MNDAQARALLAAAFPVPGRGTLAGPADDLADEVGQLVEAQIRARLPALSAAAEEELRARLPGIIADAQPQLAEAARQSFAGLVQSQDWQTQTGNVQAAIAEAEAKAKRGALVAVLASAALATLGTFLVTRR